MTALSIFAQVIRSLVIVTLAGLAAACDSPLAGRPPSQDTAKTEKSEKTGAPPAVTQTAELVAVDRAQRLTGVATILSSDPLLQLNADLSAARISADFSTATAERYRATNSLSRQIIETAERQAGIDTTQQKLLESRLKQTWGEAAPFLDQAKRQSLIASLSAGTDALVRMDFAEMTGGPPRNVQIAPLPGGTDTPVKTVWVAPSGNLSMPGVSYFGLIDAGPGLRPGDRARVSAGGHDTTPGVFIPNAAIVLFQAQSWCYVETAPGKFERRALSLDHPIDDGYIVTAGFTAGQRVVVRGASLLLSREAVPGDDDDDVDDVQKPAKSPANSPENSPEKSDAPDTPGATPVAKATTAKPEATASTKAQATSEAGEPASKFGQSKLDTSKSGPSKSGQKNPAADDDDDRPKSKVAAKRGAPAATNPIGRD